MTVARPRSPSARSGLLGLALDLGGPLGLFGRAEPGLPAVEGIARLARPRNDGRPAAQPVGPIGSSRPGAPPRRTAWPLGARRARSPRGRRHSAPRPPAQ